MTNYTIHVPSTILKVGSALSIVVQTYGVVGNLVAMHRKVHLFDIDIPGKIKFKVKNSRSAAKDNDTFTAGERDAYRWHQLELVRNW